MAITYAQFTIATTNLGGLPPLDGDADGAVDQWISGVQTNSTYHDVRLTVALKAGGTVAGGKAAYVYLATSEDGGTTWPDAIPASGTGLPLKHTSGKAPTPLILLGVVPLTTASATFIKSGMSVAEAAGGTMPQKWAVVIRQSQGSGNNLDSTDGNHAIKAEGVTFS